jgi:hypothetical protein
VSSKRKSAGPLTPKEGEYALQEEHAVLLEREDGEPILDFVFEAEEDLSQILESTLSWPNTADGRSAEHPGVSVHVCWKFRGVSAADTHARGGGVS